jgi:hypothetical protein
MINESKKGRDSLESQFKEGQFVTGKTDSKSFLGALVAPKTKPAEQFKADHAPINYYSGLPAGYLMSAESVSIKRVDKKGSISGLTGSLYYLIAVSMLSVSNPPSEARMNEVSSALDEVMLAIDPVILTKPDKAMSLFFFLVDLIDQDVVANWEGYKYDKLSGSDTTDPKLLASTFIQWQTSYFIPLIKDIESGRTKGHLKDKAHRSGDHLSFDALVDFLFDFKDTKKLFKN